MSDFYMKTNYFQSDVTTLKQVATVFETNEMYVLCDFRVC
jgi:hypothetical protein